MTLRGFASVQTVVPARPPAPAALVGAWCRRRLALLTLALVVGALWAGDVPAHDASAWGGLFRTRDAGATWQHLTPASFGSGALALAISPVDANHLLLATDSGVSRSRNGGRDWEIEAPGILIGPAFAVAFDVDGEHALVSGASRDLPHGRNGLAARRGSRRLGAGPGTRLGISARARIFGGPNRTLPQ